MREDYTGNHQLRHERVQKVLAYTPDQPGPGRPSGGVVRDVMMPFASSGFAKAGGNEWLYGHHIDVDQPIAAETVTFQIRAG